MKFLHIEEVVVLAIMLVGLVLKWLQVDPMGIGLAIGFSLFGIVGLIQGLRDTTPQNRTRRAFLVAIPLFVIVLAAISIYEKESNTTLIAICILFYSTLLRKERNR
jgi:UDP-N-acetylmuramyl pentapeptide phosphotransferase/UDP-N-acetylglucosamine-1-phosphate transferase